MLYGLCVNMTAEADRLAGIRLAPALKKMGYDYIEIPTNRLSLLGGQEFDEGKRILKDCGLTCRTCNDFMPMQFRVVGEELTPWDQLEEYFRRAFFRIGRNGLGAHVVVFGSPWCRTCPEGFPHETAFRQLAEFLGKIGEIARQEGLVIGIENNNRTETNMLNRLADIGRMTELIDLPNVGILCDYYHLRFEDEAPDEPAKYPGKIVHTHIAKLEKRAYVTNLDGEMPYMAEYAKALHAIGYEGGISIEAKPDPARKWEEEAAENLRVLKSVFEA